MTDRPRHSRSRLVEAIVLALAVVAPPSVGGAPAAGAGPCRDLPATAAAVRALVDEHDVTGAAIEVREGDCVWRSTAGVADLDTRRPMPVGERVRVGSTTKAFTATVVLRLVERGLVDLDRSVHAYLPGVVDTADFDGRRISVADLLRHTSGLPDHVDALDWDDLDSVRHRTFTDEELVDLALSRPPPTAEWTYSSTNYVLAGMIAEAVTGTGVAALIESHLLAPLGLDDTYWPVSETIAGPHPRGHFPAGDGPSRIDVTAFDMSFAGAAGALVSSLADQARFWDALLDGRLLGPDTLALMRATVPADPDRMWPGASYGLGLIATEVEACGAVMWGHGGTVPGYTTRGGLADGRSVQLVLNDNTTDAAGAEALDAAVRTAVCEHR